jgi:hypothetical protein
MATSLNNEKENHRSSSEKGTTMDKQKETRLMEVDETGHIQELERNFSIFSLCSVGIVTGNTWAALGGSIVVAIYNGGPPGVLYEFMVVSIFYWLVAASIAVSRKYRFDFRADYIYRSLHRQCPVALESIIGLRSLQAQNMDVYVDGLRDGGIHLLGFVLLVSFEADGCTLGLG